jgi:hypothetical protein
VKKEFAPRWKERILGKQNGADVDDLREMKQGVLNDRKAVCESLRDSAYTELLDARKAEYR